MKVLIAGAAGGLGRNLVEQALTAGHEVTALLRNPLVIETKHERLKFAHGDLLNATSVDAAVRGQDVVLAAVAPKMRLRQQTTLFSRGVASIGTAMEQHGVRRLLWVTSAGIDPSDLKATGFFFSRVFKPLFLEGVYADCVISENVLRKSGLDWISIHPTRLTDGPYTGKYRVDPWHIPPNGKEISRADVADFMLKQLGDDRYVHKTPALAY